MKRDPVTFDPAMLKTIGTHLLNSLALQSVPVLCISVATDHCHLLIQCSDNEPRDSAGNLKNHVYHRLFKNRASPWEQRSHEEPIEDRAHAVNTFHYVLD